MNTLQPEEAADKRHPVDKRHQIVCRAIGYVENDFDDPAALDGMQAVESRIVLDPSLMEGLKGLKSGQRIMVVFYFHRSRGFDLLQHPQGDRSRPRRGVFALRSPRRPNPIGVTVVDLPGPDIILTDENETATFVEEGLQSRGVRRAGVHVQTVTGEPDDSVVVLQGGLGGFAAHTGANDVEVPENGQADVLQGIPVIGADVRGVAVVVDKQDFIGQGRCREPRQDNQCAPGCPHAFRNSLQQ